MPAKSSESDQHPALHYRGESSSGSGANGRAGEERPPGPRDRRPGGSGDDERSPLKRHRGWIVGLGVFAVLLLVNYFASASALKSQDRLQIPYQPTFLGQVRQGNVASISSQGDAIQANLKHQLTYKKNKASKVSTLIPTFANSDQLSAALDRQHVTVNAKPADQGPPVWESILVGFGPTILLVALFVWLFRRAAAAGGAGGMMGIGRSKARRASSQDVKVTFDDVAGIDEAKEDLTEIVEFLRNPTRFTRLGGRMPRGVLLSGQPGTGKTLMARAVAGQAGAPFFQMSASEFVEMIVGVGASRVRDLFSQAKQEAPAIIFIDELDAIGRKRGGDHGFGGTNDEREQTLNQILTEMDGFDPTAGIVVIAATNRPEILDPALLRPGRFDRQVTVAPPDREGRLKILQVHTRGLPMDEDVDLGTLASQTPGMVGADLANLANEAALMAARRDHRRVMRQDFGDALERILLGAERRMLLSDEDKRRTAYHESGHAIVGMLTPHADPVRKVSIIPRGASLGVTFAAPDADRVNYQLEYLLAKIDVALGGRTAEEVVFGNITTGAESDIQQLTAIARQMVGRWGMSEAVGPVAVLPAESHGPLLPGVSESSEEMRKLVDSEVRRLVDDAHARVTTLLHAHRAQLDSLVVALLERETLDEPDAYAAASVPTPTHAGPGDVEAPAPEPA